MKPQLIILDRDGVINEDSDAYIKSVEEWLPIPGSIEAMSRLSQAGYTLAIATNQSGIARGYYTEATLHAMHAKMQGLLDQHGGQVAQIAWCPHLNEHRCTCRKPKPGMLLQLLQQLDYRPEQAIMVGDSLRDWQAADAAGLAYIQVRTGKGERTLNKGDLPTEIPVFDNLAAYAATLLD